MCGRAACTVDPARLVELYKPRNNFRNQSSYRKSFNVGPYSSSHLPVVSEQEDPSHNVSTDLAAMQWGLAPYWNPQKQGSDTTKLFNARVGMFLFVWFIIASYFK